MTGISSAVPLFSERPFVASFMGIFFKERFLGGNHELRLGAEYRRCRSQSINRYSGGALKFYMNGRPLYASVARDGNLDCVSSRLGLFANEAWTIGRLTLCLDAFNVFNLAHDLSRYPTVNSPRHDEIQQILNPRVIRLGVMYNF